MPARPGHPPHRPRRTIALAALAALVALGAGCVRPATDVVVELDTDAPPDRTLTVRVAVYPGDVTPGDGGGAAGSVLAVARGGALGTTAFPASFGITAGDGPTDALVTLVVDAQLAANTPAEQTLTFRRIARFRLIAGETGRLPIFLAVDCGLVTSGCSSATGADCTLSEFCLEQGQTCGDDARCTGVDTTVLLDGGTRDAARPDAATLDAPGDASEDAPADVAIDAPMDAPADVTMDAPRDVAVDAPRDVPCGALTEPCCPGSVCATGAACHGGACVPCGAVGQPCCTTASSCAAGARCSGGTCVCAPNCAGRSCGPDGCGGTCGSCSTCQTCSSTGACVALADGTACTGGDACCSGACVSLTSSSNCGGCGIACASPTMCAGINGAWACFCYTSPICPRGQTCINDSVAGPYCSCSGASQCAPGEGCGPVSSTSLHACSYP